MSKKVNMEKNKNVSKKKTKKVFTITFGESAENHVGMQKIGKLEDTGFTPKELLKAKKKAEKLKYKTKLIKLHDILPEKYRKKLKGIKKATVLVIKNGVKLLLGKNGKKFYNEIKSLTNIVDKKAFMYGRVVNKTARYNLCFGEKKQEPNYKKKKGTIVAFKSLKYLNHLRKMLPKLFGKKAKKLLAELNYYYDKKRCGISFHGDSERRRVIAIRLGSKLPLYYQWFYKGKPVGKRQKIKLNGNDIYIMSEKAVGSDWKKKTVPTLRHACGAPKFLKIKTKNLLKIRKMIKY